MEVFRCHCLFSQATGEAEYIDDMPHAANELFGAFVLSTEAHADIVSIDTSVALALPGVHSVVTSDDVPVRIVCATSTECVSCSLSLHTCSPQVWTNILTCNAVRLQGSNDIGVVVRDEEIFASKTVRCVGAPIALVLASSQVRFQS